MVSRIVEVWVLVVTAAIQIASVNIHDAVDARIRELEASQIEINDTDADMMAKLVWGEARGCSTTEQAAVVWCVLNRVDAGFADGTIKGVITAKSQFTGYRSSNPITATQREIAVDVLTRWYREKNGEADVGRVLPKEYLYFSGDGIRNIFRTQYKGGTRWNWSLPSPYEN